MTYLEYQEIVFNWLMKQTRELNSRFFHVLTTPRRYPEYYLPVVFNNRSFQTTFWKIQNLKGRPGGYSIDIRFYMKINKFMYSIIFSSPKKSREENSVLKAFFDDLKKQIAENFTIRIGGPNDVFPYFEVEPKEEYYSKVELLLIDLKEDLDKLFPLVDVTIINMKKDYPLNQSGSFTADDFQKEIKMMDDRRKKNENGGSDGKNMNDIELEGKEDDHRNEFNGPLNLILNGPPGTGKTYNTIEKAIEITNPKFIFPKSADEKKDRAQIKEEYQTLYDKGRIIFTTFHQSLGYEEFIEGIKPDKNKDEEVVYNIENGIFKLICNRALYAYYKYDGHRSGNIDEFVDLDEIVDLLKKDKEIQNFLKEKTIEKYEIANNVTPEEVDNIEKFVLIIDEINRGNVSKIFGELITLIEEDKRLGNSEELSVILPYSKEQFFIPPNVYIIGTMNTADRSVEALDIALRRRFSFEEIKPDLKLLKIKIIDDIYLDEILKTINERIERLLDRDHVLGHSYFFKIKDSLELHEDLDDKIKPLLKEAFKEKIIPLLQEYFYGDYGKIGLVLGKGFFEQQQPKPEFATFDEYEDTEQFSRAKFELRTIDENFDILSALRTLLKMP